MDRAEEVLEAFVFGEPGADLGEKFLGYINGACLAVLFEGQMLAGMQGSAVVAAAPRATAAMGVDAEGGGENGGRGGQLVEALLEHAEDDGGVFADAHGDSTTRERRSGRKEIERKEPEKPRCDKDEGVGTVDSAPEWLIIRSEVRTSGAKKLPFLKAGPMPSALTDCGPKS